MHAGSIGLLKAGRLRLLRLRRLSLLTGTIGHGRLRRLSLLARPVRRSRLLWRAWPLLQIILPLRLARLIAARSSVRIGLAQRALLGHDLPPDHLRRRD
jgi:hypothetical protein